MAYVERIQSSVGLRLAMYIEIQIHEKVDLGRDVHVETSQGGLIRDLMLRFKSYRGYSTQLRDFDIFWSFSSTPLISSTQIPPPTLRSFTGSRRASTLFFTFVFRSSVFAAILRT